MFSRTAWLSHLFLFLASAIALPAEQGLYAGVVPRQAPGGQVDFCQVDVDSDLSDKEARYLANKVFGLLKTAGTFALQHYGGKAVGRVMSKSLAGSKIRQQRRERCFKPQKVKKGSLPTKPNQGARPQAGGYQPRQGSSMLAAHKPTFQAPLASRPQPYRPKHLRQHLQRMGKLPKRGVPPAQLLSAQAARRPQAKPGFSAQPSKGPDRPMRSSGNRAQGGSGKGGGQGAAAPVKKGPQQPVNPARGEPLEESAKRLESLQADKFPKVDKHYRDHVLGERQGRGKEWGDSVMKKQEYLSKAHELADAPIGKNIKGFVPASGWTFKYNEVTNEFLTMKPDGTIETLFRPEQGAKYYQTQVLKYGSNAATASQ